MVGDNSGDRDAAVQQTPSTPLTTPATKERAMADPESTVDFLRSLSLDEFNESKSTFFCCCCGRRGHLVVAPVSTNGGLRVDCPDCGKQHALGRVLFLKQNNRKIRKEYPFGESLDEVWERFSNVCVVCGAPKDFLDRVGIKRERHHILEYVKHEHTGPLVSMCGPCHTNTTERQKLFWFWHRQTEQ
jgi:hypothetical protein